MGETITPQELAAMLQSKSATVCDVRREADYQADQRTIAGAEWHNPEHVDQWAAQLPKDKPVAIYCVRGGSVSKSVHAALTGKGFDVRYVEGGLAAFDEHFLQPAAVLLQGLPHAVDPPEPFGVRRFGGHLLPGSGVHSWLVPHQQRQCIGWPSGLRRCRLRSAMMMLFRLSTASSSRSLMIRYS